MTEKNILISAGEASSDMYAARLAIALRARTGAKFFGMAVLAWQKRASS
jgi:lipid A disaccharide synthetase